MPGEGKPGKGEPGEGELGKGEPGKDEPGKGKQGKGKQGKGKQGKGKQGKGKRGKGKQFDARGGWAMPGHVTQGRARGEQGMERERRPNKERVSINFIIIQTFMIFILEQ